MEKKPTRFPAVLILQHPQEPEKEKSSTPLLIEELRKYSFRYPAKRLDQNSTEFSFLVAKKVGLSWPNLSRAIPQEWKESGLLKEEDLQPRKWLVLYLGSKRKAEAIDTKGIPEVSKSGPRNFPKAKLIGISKKGEEQILPNLIENFKGIIILDGTWSQAKTLWWRNAWLLKCQRAWIETNRPSRYGRLRKEPRSGCLSTLETTVETLRCFINDHEFGEGILQAFSEFVRNLLQTQSKKTHQNTSSH